MDLKKDIHKLLQAKNDAEKYDIDINSPVLPTLDFKKSRENLCIQNLKNSISTVKKQAKNLTLEDEELSNKIQELVKKLDTKDKEELFNTIDELYNITKEADLSTEKSITLPNNIPTEIYSELEADLNEIQKCFDSGSYRSVVILCGRVLETSLHRKYYESTGNDLLEKSPGIGLGNLIAKMKDKGISLDPAITQQIHLINQTRVFSVHKKQQTFYPSKAQAKAVILYTVDTMNKLFSDPENKTEQNPEKNCFDELI